VRNSGRPRLLAETSAAVSNTRMPLLSSPTKAGDRKHGTFNSVTAYVSQRARELLGAPPSRGMTLWNGMYNWRNNSSDLLLRHATTAWLWRLRGPPSLFRELYFQWAIVLEPCIFAALGSKRTEASLRLFYPIDKP
jgi:hypothetical protein